MKRIDLIARLKNADTTIRKLVYEEGVCIDSALYGLLLAAMCSVENALYHVDEFKEND